MPANSNFDWRKHILECFDSTQFMALATKEPNGVWVCPVYFAYDDQWNLYFISQPESRHMRNIDQDNRVTIAIYSTAQEPRGDVFGIQMEAQAMYVPAEEAERAYAVYFTETSFRRPVKADNPPSEYVEPDSAWRLVKVVPKRMFYFDTRFFGENRIEVPNEILNRWTTLKLKSKSTSKMRNHSLLFSR